MLMLRIFCTDGPRGKKLISQNDACVIGSVSKWSMQKREHCSHARVCTGQLVNVILQMYILDTLLGHRFFSLGSGQSFTAEAFVKGMGACQNFCLKLVSNCRYEEADRPDSAPFFLFLSVRRGTSVLRP